jgi:hypothetical protein
MRRMEQFKKDWEDGGTDFDKIYRFVFQKKKTT